MFFAQKLQRTMHFRVVPFTVAVTLQVPFPTAVTVPSALTVATDLLLLAQVMAALVPDTTKRKLSPALLSVKSSRLSLSPEAPDEAVPEPLGAGVAKEIAVPPLLKLHRTMQVFSPTPATEAVRVAVPDATEVTTPFQETEATLGSLDFQAMSPVLPSGVKVAFIWKTCPAESKVKSSRFRVKPVAVLSPEVCPAFDVWLSAGAALSAGALLSEGSPLSAGASGGTLLSIAGDAVAAGPGAVPPSMDFTMEITIQTAAIMSAKDAMVKIILPTEGAPRPPLLLPPVNRFPPPARGLSSSS